MAIAASWVIWSIPINWALYNIGIMRGRPKMIAATIGPSNRTFISSWQFTQRLRSLTDSSFFWNPKCRRDGDKNPDPWPRTPFQHKQRQSLYRHWKVRQLSDRLVGSKRHESEIRSRYSSNPKVQMPRQVAKVGNLQLASFFAYLRPTVQLVGNIENSEPIA